MRLTYEPSDFMLMLWLKSDINTSTGTDSFVTILILCTTKSTRHTLCQCLVKFAKAAQFCTNETSHIVLTFPICLMMIIP